jgi:hypothetical protein
LKGLRICAAISVAGSAALSIFAATTLRTIRPASHSDAPSDQHAFE